MKINLREWYVTKEEFNKWVLETKAIVRSIHVDNYSAMYDPMEFVFENEADVLAFKLKFKFKQYDYTAGVFYCPYIPDGI